MSAMDITIGHDQLQETTARCLKHNLVPYIRSQPGIGKSDAMKAFARRVGLKVIDLRLSQMTPEDLQGFPMRQDGKATFTPFDIFPLEGDEIPDGYKGWLLLLDELSSANKAVQAAAYRLILDRQVGSHNLHEDCHMVACGNRTEDKAVVHRMSTALQSRMIHFNLNVTVKQWVDWGYKNDIDFRILGYVQFNQKMFLNFNPDHQDMTYACPRTWEFLNRLIHDVEVSREKDMALICGTVGQEAGMDFLSFCAVQDTLPDWADIINPAINGKIQIPEETSARYAITSWMSTKAKEKEVELMIPYIERFNPDLQVIFCRGILSRFPNIDRSSQKFADFSMSMMVDMNP